MHITKIINHIYIDEQRPSEIILNNHIDSLCDLYVKGRFYTIQTAKKLLLRYKDSVALLNILGMSNAKINKYEDAIFNYKKAIELSPDNATTFFHLGIFITI